MNDAATLKTITKKYGNILVNGAEVFQDLKDMQVIPVSPALDYALGGGFREGRNVPIDNFTASPLVISLLSA